MHHLATVLCHRQTDRQTDHIIKPYCIQYDQRLGSY